LFFQVCVLIFYLLFSLSVNSCAQPQVHIQNDFYEGLLLKGGMRNDAITHFEKALGSSNVYIRQAAAHELAKLMYEGADLSARTVQALRRESSGAWAAVFDAVNKNVDREKALTFLLGFERDAPDETRLYIFNECGKHDVVFSDFELAAINGHFYSLHSRYNEALVFFRRFMLNETWPSQMPDLFFQYPGLINDLGRTFQYTSSGREGLDLFLQWEMNLSYGMTANTGVSEDDLRYRLLFFAARVARRMGRHDQGILLFEQALSLAPDAEQSDACIWYILDSSLNGDYDLFYLRLRRLAPLWHEKGYFDDILEKLLQRLTSDSEWEKIIRAFSVIQNTNAQASIASYAWVIARVMEERYLSDSETQLAAEAVLSRNESHVPALGEEADTVNVSPENFMRIAYDTGKVSLYYRLKSADALGEPFLELNGPIIRAGTKETPQSPALQFLLGFFSNNAANFSGQYITSLQNELSPDELRSVAQALSDNGMYIPSIRLVSLYVNRDGYTRNRQDMELMFPRRFDELIERHAAINNFEPSLMYGLIRTESAFQSDIVSHAGAVGLTQLMPDTAQDMAVRIRRAGGPDFSGENGINLKDPDINIHIGSFYLNYLMLRFDDPLLSLMAYNGGMNRVRRWRNESALPVDLFLETIPIYETRDYGKRVIAAAMVYEELYFR